MFHRIIKWLYKPNFNDYIGYEESGLNKDEWDKLPFEEKKKIWMMFKNVS